MHVLETGCLLLELVLEDRVVHKVNPCHASDDVRRLVRLVVPMASNSPCRIHYWGAYNRVDVIESWIPASILVKGIRFVLSAASIFLLLPRLISLLPRRAVGIYLIWVILLGHRLVALSSHLGHAALAHHRAAMLRVSIHDLLVHSVLARRYHWALLGNISCLLVQAILLLDHWQVRVLSTCGVRRNLLVRL